MVNRLMRRTLWPKPVRTGAAVRLEDRFQHDLGRHLRHPISDRGISQRPFAAMALGNHHEQDRLPMFAAGYLSHSQQVSASH